MEGLLPYFNMVTVPHKMVRLERMSDYRGFTVRTVHTWRRGDTKCIPVHMYALYITHIVVESEYVLPIPTTVQHQTGFHSVGEGTWSLAILLLLPLYKGDNELVCTCLFSTCFRTRKPIATLEELLYFALSNRCTVNSHKEEDNYTIHNIVYTPIHTFIGKHRKCMQ